MLSLKATLKAIGESITTIKTALDGKATKYTGYGTPVTLTTSWYTIPSDGMVQLGLQNANSLYMYVKIANNDGSKEVELRLSTPTGSYMMGYPTMQASVFEGQKVKISGTNASGSNTFARFVPFV